MDLDNKFFFALKEPSNQVTKKFAFREKERKISKLLFGMCWAMESFLME
jgi:hypothetical protein